LRDAQQFGVALARTLEERQNSVRFGVSQTFGRQRPHRGGAICRVWWSGGVSGARQRHVWIRVVSRFSALQKTCKNIEMAANAAVLERRQRRTTPQKRKQVRDYAGR